jgi:hypothetical protein
MNHSSVKPKTVLVDNITTKHEPLLCQTLNINNNGRQYNKNMNHSSLKSSTAMVDNIATTI